MMDEGYYSQLDVANALVNDFMRTTNEKANEVKAKAVAQMYSNIQAEEANRLKQEELDLKRRELEAKEAAEEVRLAREAEEAKKAYRLEVAKFIVGAVGTGFTMVCVLVSFGQGDLWKTALKSVKFGNKGL